MCLPARKLCVCLDNVSDCSIYNSGKLGINIEHVFKLDRSIMNNTLNTILSLVQSQYGSNMRILYTQMFLTNSKNTRHLHHISIGHGASRTAGRGKAKR